MTLYYIYINMKVTVIHRNSGVGEEEYKFYDNFIKFLQKEYPLKNDISIVFVGNRIGEMTTGSRTHDGELRVLTKGRINRDILRTLAHEWTHEYQMGVLNRRRGPDIGGQNEDEANAISGQVMKKFEKKYPKIEKKMYD
jgi:hypothetical protein